MLRNPLDSSNSREPDAVRATVAVIAGFIAILALHILLRMIFFEGISASDPLRYVRIAYQRLSGDYGLVYEHRAARFGVILPVALSFKLFGMSEVSAVLWPMLASVGTLYLIFRFGTLLASPGVGLLASLLFALQPLDIALATTLLPDSILTFLMTSCMYCFYRGYHCPDNRRAIPWLISSGIFLWGAYAAKELGVLLLPVIFTYVFFKERRWGRVGWVLVGLSVFLGPELIHYKVQSGEWLYRLHAIEPHHSTPEVAAANENILYRWFISYPKIFLLRPGAGGLIFLIIGLAVLYGLWFGRQNLLILLWFVAVVGYLNFGSSSLSEYIALPAIMRFLHPALVPGLILVGAALSHLGRNSDRRESAEQSFPGADKQTPAKQISLLPGGVAAVIVLTMVLSLTFSYLSVPGGTRATAYEMRQITEFLRSEPEKVVYADRRSRRMLQFLLGYENVEWLKDYPVPTDTETVVSYLNKLDGNAFLVFNWREIYRTTDYGILSTEQRQILMDLADSGRLNVVRQFHRKPTRVFRAVTGPPLPDRLRSETDRPTLVSADERPLGSYLFAIERGSAGFKGTVQVQQSRFAPADDRAH